MSQIEQNLDRRLRKLSLVECAPNIAVTADSPPNLIDYVITIGVPEKCRVGAVVGTRVETILGVVAVFPEEGRDGCPIPTHLWSICFPEGCTVLNERDDSSVSELVVTNALGVMMYGVAVTYYDALETPDEDEEELWFPMCLCVMSRWPYFKTLREIATQLYLINNYTPDQLTGEVARALDFNLPKPGEEAVIELESATMYCSRPSDGDFPRFDVDFRRFFASLSCDDVITMLASLLLERRLVFVSSKREKLVAAACAITTLMFPLIWQYPCVPVVPSQLVDIVESPTPFIAGFLSSMTPLFEPLLTQVDDIVVCYLDRGYVRLSKPVPQMPEPQTSILRLKLNDVVYRRNAPVRIGTPPLHSDSSGSGTFELAQQSSDVLPPLEAFSPSSASRELDKRVRLCFLRFFTALLMGFRRYVDIWKGEVMRHTFDKKAFCSVHPEATEFLSAFCESQAFNFLLGEILVRDGGIFEQMLEHERVKMEERNALLGDDEDWRTELVTEEDLRELPAYHWIDFGQKKTVWQIRAKPP